MALNFFHLVAGLLSGRNQNGAYPGFLASFLLSIMFASLTGQSAQSAAFQSCGSNQIRVAITPAPPQRPLSYVFFDQQMAALGSSADVVLLGDSMMQRWPAQMLEQIFPGRKLLNLGIMADHTQNVLWRMRNMPLSSVAPEYAVFLVGTNNVDTLSEGCGIAAGVSALVTEAFRTWPALKQVYIIGILPRLKAGHEHGETIAAANALLQYLARISKKTTYIEPPPSIGCSRNTLTLDTRVSTAELHERPCMNYEKDEIHLSNKGYEVLSTWIARSMTVSE